MKIRLPFKFHVSQRLVTHFVLIILCIPFLMPLLWMVSTSLKTENQIYATEQDKADTFSLKNMLPNPIKWSNYPDAMKMAPFGTYVRNTLFLCILNIVGVVLSSALVAYGFARLRFAGRDLLFGITICTMALPAQVTMIPLFALFKHLGWYGTYLPLVVPAFCGNAFFIFLLRQFLKTIPEDLSEAARIDGASEWCIFWKIILPVTVPALATCALFQFLYTWNDFFGPLLYINDPSLYTIAYGLQQFMGSHEGKWDMLMAGACIFSIPVIILFFFVQKTFIQGIATTGSKG